MPIFQAASHLSFSALVSPMGSGIKYSHQSQDEISSGVHFLCSEVRLSTGNCDGVGWKHG